MIVPSSSNRGVVRVPAFVLGAFESVVSKADLESHRILDLGNGQPNEGRSSAAKLDRQRICLKYTWAASTIRWMLRQSGGTTAKNGLDGPAGQRGRAIQEGD